MPIPYLRDAKGRFASVEKVDLFTSRVKGGRGYLLIENRHSPVALTQRLPNGETIVIAAGATFEAPTLTCCHCNAVTVLNPRRSRPRNWCAKCHAYVCDLAGCNRDCTPTTACIDLALAHTGSGQDFLGRGKDGSVLFDTRLRDRTRIH